VNCPEKARQSLVAVLGLRGLLLHQQCVSVVCATAVVLIQIFIVKHVL
jgi:hypothetical protein